MNRMALFSINIIAGSLLDGRHNTHITKPLLEKILTQTHELLSLRAPVSLLEHDKTMQSIQDCIDCFCESIGEPSAEFLGYSERLRANQLREFDS